MSDELSKRSESFTSIELSLKSGSQPEKMAAENRIAVCSWSLQPKDLRDLAAKLSGLELYRVQLALDPLRESPADWRGAARFLQDSGVQIVSGMFGCVGEDYSTLDAIRATGGIAPDSTWEQNLKNIRAAVKLAAELGLKLVTFHAGFLPENEASPDFVKLSGRLITVAEIFAGEKIRVALETGQESATALAALLEKLDQPNLGVNFDPANMILYGKGDPIKALQTLGKWIFQVHIKDAKPARVPGTWGEEVVVGTGEVAWRDFFPALKKINFKGDLVIEREAGGQRAADIGTARALVLDLIG